MSNITKIDKDGTPISVITYQPIGIDHELQRDITNMMHNLVLNDGRFTLAELGYLHASDCVFDRITGDIKMRVYFHAQLAARMIQSDTSSNSVIKPIRELSVFESYLYVGNLNDVIEYDNVLMPKTDIVNDEIGRASLVFKGNGAKMVETPVLIINCNLAILLAAITGTNLLDRKFNIKCETLGAVKKGEIMLTTSSDRVEMPIKITVTRTADPGSYYDPSDAIPYLSSQFDEISEKQNEQIKLEETVRKKARDSKKDKKKKAKESDDKGFFSKYS